MSAPKPEDAPVISQSWDAIVCLGLSEKVDLEVCGLTLRHADCLYIKSCQFLYQVRSHTCTKLFWSLFMVADREWRSW